MNNPTGVSKLRPRLKEAEVIAIVCSGIMAWYSSADSIDTYDGP